VVRRRGIRRRVSVGIEDELDGNFALGRSWEGVPLAASTAGRSLAGCAFARNGGRSSRPTGKKFPLESTGASGEEPERRRARKKGESLDSFHRAINSGILAGAGAPYRRIRWTLLSLRVEPPFRPTFDLNQEHASRTNVVSTRQCTVGG
jgi:hypothetical protein